MSEAPLPRLSIVRDTADAPALPLPETGTELERQVFEGEVVEDEPSPDIDRSYRLPATIAGRVVSVQPSVRAVAVVGAAVTVGQGWHSWFTRAFDGLTLGVYRRQIRAAETAGDQEALVKWVELKQREAHQRHARMMDLPMKAIKILQVAGIALIGTLVLLLLLSIAVWATGVGSFGAVWSWVGWLIRTVLSVLAFLWPAITVGVPTAVLVAAWREGRRAGTPMWIVGGGEDPEGRDVIPDEGAILNALRKLGIAELNKAFKDGWRPRFPLPTHKDGKGYRTQLELPAGVTVEMINKKKKILAHNLVRFPIEVWPTEPKAGVLDLWVADPGALTGPVDPWPLLHEGTTDYFKGVPVGFNIRGKTIIGRLSEANYALAGMMGSGKSTLIIDLLLGAILDPLVEADVFVMAVNADYDPMKPRLRTLLTGTGEEIVERCLNTLREAYGDLDTRGKALKEHGARAVNRALAEKDARLRPRIIVVDECQALFMHEMYGEEAISLAVRLLNAARKYGYTLIFATPEPSSASLPRKLMAVISNKACFAIGDQHSNDAALGTGSYTAGISAVGLEPKTDEGMGDVGTCMAKGFEPKPNLLRCFYVSERDAGAVVERAMKLRELAGISSSVAAVIEEARDLLDDLDEVLGEERIRLSDIPGLLRKLAPDWHPYQGLTGIQLRDILTREHGVKVTNTGNVLRLDPADLRQVRALRETSE